MGSPDYHDSPEYRKILHLQGEEKEAMLASLRARLGMSGAAAGVSKDVKQHQGVDTGSAGGAATGAAGGESMAKAEDGYAYAASASSSYSYSSSSSATYEEPTTTPYETTTTYESTTTYEAPTEAPYDEPPSYTEPQDGDSGADMGGQAPASSMGGGHAPASSDEKHELE